MEKKESDNIHNKSAIPNNDIHNWHDYNYSKSFSLERISEIVNEDDASDYVYLNYVEDVPDFIQVPISPELQELGIEVMALLEGKPIFKTKSGIVVTIENKTGFHQLLMPTQKPYRKHAAILSEISYQFLNSHIFKSPLGERKNSQSTKSKKNIMDNGDFNHDEFFLDLVNQVNEIVSNLNPNGIIRIPKTNIIKLGFRDTLSFEEGFLDRVYAEVARLSRIDFETIKEKMKDRVVPV